MVYALRIILGAVSRGYYLEYFGKFVDDWTVAIELMWKKCGDL